MSSKPNRQTIVKKFSIVNRTTNQSRKAQVAAKPASSVTQATTTQPSVQAVVGVPFGMNAAGLRPIARVEVMSVTRTNTFNGSIGVLSATCVADPTGTATDALGVDNWANRFNGFQQYRIRKTKWILCPVRPNVGTTTSSQGPGCVGMWIQDSPQTGPPTTAQFLEANRKMIPVNTDRVETLEYATNEPQDLNLSDISSPPSHIVNTSIDQGQHCFQLYGDDTLTGMVGYPNSGFTPVFAITALYDIEFFGVGGV